MPIALKIFIGMLLFMVPVNTVMVLIGQGDVAIFASIEASAFAVLGLMAYAVFFHSKKRWPELGWQQRLTKIVWIER